MVNQHDHSILLKMEKRIYTRLIPLLNHTFSEEKTIFAEVNGQSSIFSPQLFQQAFSLLLSSILLFNSIGYYPLYKLKQWEIHIEMKSLMKNTLTNENLQCIAITEANSDELEWEWEWEDEQEFTYKNNRYDVVRTEVKHNVTHYFCIQDTQETKLFAQLEQDVEQQMDDEKTPLQNTTKKLLKSCSWIVSIQSEYLLSNETLRSTSLYSSYYCLYPCTFLNRVTPPPKLIVS